MALQYTVVEFVSPAAAGGTTTVPLGFVGKAALLFGTRTSGTQGLAAAFRVGADDGTNRVSIAINPGLFGTHQSDGYLSGNNSILAMRTQGLNELMVAANVTFVGTDMIVHWNFILVATGVRFYALVFGGVNAKVISVSPDASIPASLSTTALGFQPTVLIGFTAVATGAGTTLQAGRGTVAVGVTGSILCGQGTLFGGYQPFPAGGIVDAVSYLRAGEWVTDISASPWSSLRTTTLVSFDPLGFTMAQTLSNVLGVLALDGCTANIGSFTQPSSTGPQSIPLLMAAPRVAIIMGGGHPASISPTNDLAWSFGVGDATTQKSVWMGALAGSAAERTDAVENEDSICILHTPTGNFTSVQNSRAQLTGLISQELQLDWKTASGAANEWIYAVIGDDLGTGPCGEPTPPVACVPDSPIVPGDATAPTEFSSGSVTGSGGIIV